MISKNKKSHFAMKKAFLYLFSTILIFSSCQESPKENPAVQKKSEKVKNLFSAPDTASIPKDELGDAIRYGRKLIENTAFYIGPEGTKGKYLGNKMNCTNCHLDAGTRPFALSYFSTHARYPQYRSREDRILTTADRVNNCIERPHNGKPLPLDSYEMTAILSYIKWVGTGVQVDGHVEGDKGIELEFPDIAADPNRGETIYKTHCASCHGQNGEGLMRADNVCFIYPPLWGENSYQPGSSMHRIIKAAQFIKANMPKDSATYDRPKLTTQEALDVAAFINDDRIHDRPQSKGANYPNPSTKPIDYGFGPYNDPFSETEHKFGPFTKIIAYKKEKNQKIVY